MNGENTNVIPSGEGGHTMAVSDLPVEALRGILDKLNEKGQSATKLFQKNYKISTNDIRQLLEKVHQEFHSCKVISRSATVSLTLSKSERYDFRTWAEFEKFDTSQSSRTTSLQIEMTYDVIRNNDEVPERYVVQMSVQNLGPSIEIFLGPISLSSPGKFPVPPAAISATIRYNNYILGKNIIATIDSWEKSLEVDDNKIIEFLQGQSNRISRGIFYLSSLGGVLFSSGLTLIPSLTFQFWLIYSAACALIFSFAGYEIGKFVERNIDHYTDGNIITLTRGDIKRNNMLGKRNRNVLLKAFAATFLFFIQLAIGIWAQELVPKLSSIFGS